MKLVCTQENLSRSLSHLERVVGRQSALPILANFLLETEKGRLKISATNLEIGVVAYIGAKIEREGRVTVPAKLLSSFIHNLPIGDVLELEADAQTLKVGSAKHTMRIRGMDGKDFPIIPQYKEEYFFSLPAQELKNALSRLLFCVSLNEARLELTGVHIFFYPEALHLAATDSFRLAEEILPFIGHGSGYVDFLKNTQALIIPGNTCSELLRIIAPESTEVKVALRDNQVFFEIDGVQVISRVINGKYPDYKQIIPKEFSHQYRLSKEGLQRAIKIASVFSSYTSNEVSLSFDPEEKTCTIASQSQEIGENKTVLEGEFLQGSTPLQMTFNPRFVLDGLNALLGEWVYFSANSATTPAALRMAGDGDAPKGEYVYIMMPIRK